MVAVPDTEDWSWVLTRACPECGFDARTVARDQVVPMLRDNAAAWLKVLEREDVRDRPSANEWSPLEYACHTRSIFRLCDIRLSLMRTSDDPLFAAWDQYSSAIADRYNDQNPAEVAVGLREAATTLALNLADMRDDEWERPGRRGDGVSFTVESFARYFLHDTVHNLHMVTTARPTP